MDSPLRRPRVLIPAVIIAVGLTAGFFAVKSRNDDNAPLKTTNAARNCPPVARADAAATKPNEPIAVDVLANDTDADGDTLVFQIGDVEGGTAAIDDGGTPTDASDDRLLFTPDNPAPLTATIDYEALDPSGATDASNVAISVNETATMPDGVRSALATDPAKAGTQPEECRGSTTTTVDESLTAAGATTTVTDVDDESTDGTVGSNRRTTTTRKGSKSAGTTTTTEKKSTATTGGGSNNNNNTTTTKKPTTTTTRPPSSSTTRPPSNNPCVEFGQNSPQCEQWKNQQDPRNTTTTAPQP